MLQADGLVDAAPNRGATVRTHSAADLDDLYELRALLEGYASRRAARRILDEDVTRLAASCDRFEDIVDGDIADIVAENNLFHGVILEVAGSSRLATMVRSVVELPLVYRSYVYYSPEQTRISLHYHRQLTTAFAQRDPDRAELLMKEHVYEARDVLIQHVRAVAAGSADAEGAE
jgi:DNA-binding GntR family transcriptional regulator